MVPGIEPREALNRLR
jgi:dynein heavy chain